MTVWQILLGGVLLASWEFLATHGVLDKFFFSRPGDIASRVMQWILTGSIWPHLLVTMEEAVLSFTLGVSSGILFGFLLARAPFISDLLNPYIRVLNALPRVVLAPIFLLWFGLGIWSKVALGVTVVFFIVFFNTYQGVREVDPVVLNNARMLGASERQLIRHVLVPSALTWIFSSLHISIGFAIIAVVVGEYLGSSRGIGYLISQAEGVFDTTGVFAGMVILSLVVLAVGVGVDRLERWLLRWKPQRQSASLREVA
jgi:NitT/TauT family transport system permease protein